MKWNVNSGHCNLTPEAVECNMHQVASFFSHYTFCATGGKLAIVDLQGWDQNDSITFTDLQIHTHTLASSDCPLKDRFSWVPMARQAFSIFLRPTNARMPVRMLVWCILINISSKL
mmetsp:Transcript_24908/g.44844  ORF Transcript_24908/g.44844 Transcript_24908/m.44844 type:complete len:116 (-) Transcript_24908:154-501(-)